MSELQADTTALLRDLIRLDTVNPPGRERPAAEHLYAVLEAAGFDCELVGAEPERPNLVARLEAQEPGDGPALCLLGHTDTVLATPAEWTHDPWSGDEADGCVWGRGALDMKGQVAAEVAAAVGLARDGWRPRRGTLIVAAVADEEAGGALGAKWLTEQRPDLVRCDYLLNEGGGTVLPWEGRRLYGVCCAEKGIYRFTLSTDGVAGHASMPRMGDNALLKMAPLLARLAERQPEYDLTPEPSAFLAALGGEGDPAAAVRRAGAQDPRLAVLLEPMLGVTVAPTRIRASDKVNVIPSAAHLQVDCRVPPGLGAQDAERRVRELLEGLTYRLEFDEQTSGNRSPMQSPLMDFISGWIEEQDPGALVVPTMLPGYTDSRSFREAFPECVAYGFFPQRHMDQFQTAPLIHGADERIDVRDLGFAAGFYRDVTVELLG